jgi:hypothetical protein
MSSAFKYQLEIKHRATPPHPYKWEIYETDAPMMWVEQSSESFRSRKAAIEAGEKALAGWLAGTKKRRRK